MQTGLVNQSPAFIERGDFGEHLFGEFWAADQQVGHVGFGLFIDQRRPVDAGEMEAVRLCDGDRRAGVPFIMAAGMEVDFGLAGD
jgi:hypothetical protein